MPNNKKIEFGTSADTKGLDTILERLKKLGQAADDISARLSKIKIGSSARGDDLTNVVKTTTVEMGKLRLESIKTAETMSDRLGRAVLTNTQQIRQQTREFQHAARAARDLSGTTIQTASHIGRIMGIGGGTTATSGAAMGAMMGGGGGYGAYGGGRGGGGPIPPGMNFGAYAQRPPNPWTQVPTFQAGINAAQGTLGAAGGVSDLAGRYGQYETSTAMMGLTNLARAQSYRQDIYRLSANAPVGYGAYIQGRATAYSTGKSNSTQNLLMEGAASGDASRVGRDKATTGASAIDEMASAIIKGKATTQAAELSSTAIKATGKVLDAVGNVVKLNISKAGADLKGAAGAGFDAAELSKSVATGGLSADRAQAQSAALATLQQIAGPQAQAAFGALQGYAPLLATSARMNAGMGRQAMGMGAGAGYDVGSSSATLASLGQHFGTRAVMGGLGQQAFAMSRKGMDAGIAGGIMGQIGMGGGDGGATLERIFAKGVREGMDSLDMRFFEKIGGAIAESAITQSGEVSGGNLPEALMFGLRKGSTMADVQGNIAGRQFVDQTMTQNPFFASRSMSLAASALGPNASALKTQAMTETGINDLMADKNAYLDALGIDKGTRQKFAKDRLEMMGTSMAAGAGFGENAESKRIREGIAKYGSFQKYLEKGGEGTTQFVGAVAKAMGLTQDYKTAVGGMNYIAGTGAEAGTTGGKSVLKDVVDGQAITNIATQTRIIFKQFENVNDILKQIVDGSNGAVKNIGAAYRKLADETVKNMDATMRVGEENYEGSANAAAAASAAAGGLAHVGEVSEQVATALSKLYGVTAAAAGLKEARPKPTAPNTTQPIYKEVRKVGGR